MSSPPIAPAATVVDGHIDAGRACVIRLQTARSAPVPATSMTLRISRGMQAIVDAADYPIVASRKWSAIPTNGDGWRAGCCVRADGRKTTQFMHTLLTGWPLVDHINGNGLDNRRHNLRPATPAQNSFNAKSQGGASKFKGVCRSRLNRWRSKIQHQRQTIYLGTFADEAAAAHAYDAAARRLFGKFAALNFPLPGEVSALRGRR